MTGDAYFELGSTEPQCSCGWPTGTDSDSIGHCFVCHDAVPPEDVQLHFRNLHRETFDNFQRWPDGSLVVVRGDANPEDFA